MRWKGQRLSSIGKFLSGSFLFLLLSTPVSPRPSIELNDYLMTGLNAAIDFQHRLMIENTRSTRIIAAELPGMVDTYLSVEEVPGSTYFLEAIRGNSGNIDATAVFQNYSGRWQGRWKAQYVVHQWEEVHEYTIPRFSGFGNHAPLIYSLQYAWVGDGFGWNVIAAPAGKRGNVILAGVVYHLDSHGRIEFMIPHVGIALAPNALVWITPRDIFLEEIVYRKGAGKVYRITCITYTVSDDVFLIEEIYSTEYVQLGPMNEN